MPHVVLQTHSTLHEVLEAVAPFAAQDAGTVWRLRDAYLNLEGTHALAECLIVSGGRPVRMFVHLAQREEDGAIVVRPYAVPRVDPTPAVKRMVALVAEALVASHPDVALGTTTIRDAFSDRWASVPDSEPALWDPVLPETGLASPLQWAAVFGDEHPVELEIGSGKGTFLVEAAIARPESNFVAVEWARAFAAYLGDRVQRRDLRNVRVARAEAARFFEEHVAPGSLVRIHVYFPDPWPKERHHKRRLLQPRFAALAARALAPGGELRFVTDHGEYFEAASAALDAEPALARADVPAGEMTDLTNYERKYAAEGRPIHRAMWVRREAAGG